MGLSNHEIGYVIITSLCLAIILDLIPLIAYFLSNENAAYKRMQTLVNLFHYPTLALYSIGVFLSVYSVVLTCF